MRQHFKVLLILLSVISFLNVSCRQEEYAFEGTPPDQSIKAGAKITGLLQNVALKDGSDDDILDGANCISLELPVTVTIDGENYVVNEENDYYTIKVLLESSQDSVPTLIYPVSVVLTDYSVVEVNDDSELKNLVDNCGDIDEDIECVDVVYPITVSSFNDKTEFLKKETILDDETFLNFIKDLDDADLVEISFPVDLILKDGTLITTPDLVSMETTIESYANDCDESDDFEPSNNSNNGTDNGPCDDCTDQTIRQLWVSCLGWEVQVFRLDNVNLSSMYSNYVFAPAEDGTITVTSGTETFNGTWSTSTDGTTGNIMLTFDIVGLNDFNGDWTVNEVTLVNGVSRLNLRIDNSVLVFKNGCE